MSHKPFLISRPGGPCRRRLKDENPRLDRLSGLSQNSHPGQKRQNTRLQPARALPSPRTHYRKRRRLRRTASGRSLPYNLRFPGQYYQVETGLNQNWYRDYDPLTGKYIESDPIGFKGGSYSTYAYSRVNPIAFTDPSGLQLLPPDPNASTVVCHNGHLVTQLGPLSPLDEKCLSDCMMLHELKHIDQFFAAGMGFACRNAVDGQVVGTWIENQAAWEKEAYAVEIQCLER